MKKISLLLFGILLLMSCSSQLAVQSGSTEQPAKPASPANWYSQGKSTGDPVRKIDNFSKAIAAKPDYALAYLERARAYLKISNYQKAIADIDTLLKINPDIADAYVVRARAKAYEATRYLNDALKDYSKSIELNPNPQTYLERANLYKQRKRYSKAIMDYTEVLKEVTGNADVYVARGVCYQELNQLDAAISDYKKAIELQPNNADLYYNLGSIYWVQQRWQDVVDVWEKCLELDPNHSRVKQYLPTVIIQE